MDDEFNENVGISKITRDAEGKPVANRTIGFASRTQAALLERVLIEAAVASALGMRGGDVADALLTAYGAVLGATNATDDMIDALGEAMGRDFRKLIREDCGQAKAMFEKIRSRAVERHLARTFPQGRA